MFIKKMSFTRLLKLELPQLAESVIGIVERHNPEELLIEDTFDLLLAERSTINMLTERYGSHPLTSKLKQLRELRNLKITAVLLQLKTVVKKQGEADESVELVKIEINRFFKNLQTGRSEKAINRKVALFVVEVEQRVELEAALDALNFTDLLDELQSLHATIQEITQNRLVSIAERPRLRTSELNKSLRTALKNLFKDIEVTALKNPQLDFQSMFDELNDLMDVYRAIINRRLSYNQRKLEGIENDETGDSDETPEELETTEYVEPTREMMHLTVGDESMNGNHVPLEEQLVAATSAKATQLQSVNGKS